MEGLITYHRTDSTTLSEKALTESARVIRGDVRRRVLHRPAAVQTKVKNAQEAHEAIRPTDFRLAPQQLEGVLDSDELRALRADLEAHDGVADGRRARAADDAWRSPDDRRTASRPCSPRAGKAIEFAGFRRAYVEGSDDPAAELEEQETLLPAAAARAIACTVAGGPSGDVQLLGRRPEGARDQPPARFTEASLIKELEAEGIGRPSTYAPTIATIERRGYVFRQGKALVPSFTAFAVTELLREHFGDYVDVGFTAEMEEDLDADLQRRAELARVHPRVLSRRRQPSRAREAVERARRGIDYPADRASATIRESGEPVRVRIGRYGPFLQRGEGGPGNTASMPDDVAPADLTVDKALELLQAQGGRPALARRRIRRPASTCMCCTAGSVPTCSSGETPDKADKWRRSRSERR